jgi:catechol 2,3-dioxygenase-like lactoylglutathione lyase family enzyme
MPRLGLVALVVRGYDEAIAFFVGSLGFSLVEDTRLDTKKRWVVVAPPGSRRPVAGPGGQPRAGSPGR